MNSNISSFSFSEGFYTAIMELKPKDRLAVYTAIMEYVFYGVDIDYTKLKHQQRVTLKVIVPFVDANIEAKLNGRKGGKKTKKSESEVINTTPNKEEITEEKTEVENLNLSFQLTYDSAARECIQESSYTSLCLMKTRKDIADLEEQLKKFVLLNDKKGKRTNISSFKREFYIFIK